MGHIFNKDLYDDPRDLEIAKLRFTISKFKEYDQKRKDYYKSVIEENERMKQELEDKETPTCKKDELIKQLRAKVKALNIRLTNYGLSMDGITDEDIARMREENRLNAWKLQINRLNAEVRRLKDTNFTLVYELNQEREKNKK
jgi:predicted  nucleic acid-binding Zn-ribbon protein